MEYKSGHIKGCQHIPLDKLASRAHELDELKRDCYVLPRRLRVVPRLPHLKNAGFSNVKYMDGSILAWTYGLEK